MDAKGYSELALANFASSKAGAFYGQITDQAVGVGLIFDEIEFPAFDTARGEFVLTSGLVYVLTHECDVDQSNVRSFNDLVVVCPVQRMEDFIQPFQASGQEAKLHNFVKDAAADSVSRIFYLPPPPDLLAVKGFQFGGFMNLNHLASVPIAAFDKARPVCVLSQFGLRHVDAKLQNHLLRAKDDRLPRLG